MKPLSTEKAVMKIESENILTFELDKRKTKNEIKKEIEDLFEVKVDKIRSLIRNNKKIIYSNKHEDKFIEQVEDKFLKINKSKLDKNFKIWINNYFTLSNKTKKYLLFTKYKIIRLLIRLKLYSS